MVTVAQVIEAQEKFQNELFSKANVVGVAVGYRNYRAESTDELALITLVERKLPIEALTPQDLIPRALDGMQTDVIEVGLLRANANIGPRDRHRPLIPSGVSIGHTRVTAGTLGAIVRDRETGERLILSNNHVLANSNDALIGDFILQPGPTDRGKNPDDRIARLERFIRIFFIGDPPPTSPPPPVGGDDTGRTDSDRFPLPGGCDIADLVVRFGNILAAFSGSDKRLRSESLTEKNAALQLPFQNQVDAALAKPIDPDIFRDDILDIGEINGIKDPVIGMRIHKTGRTTGHTEGIINLLNATVNVTYNTKRGARVARFSNQVITSPMSRGGDSGSLILERGTNTALGLLFAGSSLSTIFTPLNLVLDALNVTLEKKRPEKTP